MPTHHANLYFGTSTSGTLLATVEAVHLLARVRAERHVYGAAGWLEAGPVTARELELTIEGRAEEDTSLDMLRTEIGAAPRDFYLHYTATNAAWRGQFQLMELREDAPGAQERRFQARLLSSGSPVYIPAS